jgi:hypothetical protein
MLIFKEKYSFIDFAVERNFSISQFPISQKPFMPSLQYSNIPFVPARHRERSGEAGGSEAN